MWQVRGFDGTNLEGWEKGETEKKVPYYIHHDSEQTQWDHPLLAVAMEEILDCNNIKYAAYRTAMKIRTLQKFASVHLVTLPTVISLFDQHGFRLDKNDVHMMCDELEGVLVDIFHVTKRDHSSIVDVEFLAEIALNILMNFYDRQRMGVIKVSSAKVALTILCSARLQEKYKYLFRQFADHNNCISKMKLTELLEDLAQIPEYLSEKPSFGTSLVSAAVESCFAIDSGRLGVTEEAFLDWLLKQPQTLVWISTLYRLSAAENVNHDAKCRICKMQPITGLRYQCLRCFHYDLCQNCFFTGQFSRSHKLNHPLQEYCHKSTSKEGTKALMKLIKNKLSKKTISKSKQRYLPIAINASHQNLPNGKVAHEQGATSQDIDSQSTDKASKMLQADSNSDEGVHSEIGLETIQSPATNNDAVGGRKVLHHDQQRELESVILHLEEENRHLLSEIEKLHSMSTNFVQNASSSLLAASSDQRALMLARRVALEDHNHQLELQLGRLRALLHYLRQTPIAGDRLLPLTTRNRRFMQQLESTPITQATPSSFNLVSPIERSCIFIPGTGPAAMKGWDRPFGNQSGFARRSLPQTSTQFQSPGSSPFQGQTFQRASARAILQTHEFSCSGRQGPRPLDSPSYTKYTFQDLSRNLVHHSSDNAQTRSGDVGSLLPHVYVHGYDPLTFGDADTAKGLSRIQAELDDIIRQLENVYPGCSSHQYNEQSALHNCGDKTAAKVTNTLGEFCSHHHPSQAKVPSAYITEMNSTRTSEI